MSAKSKAAPAPPKWGSKTGAQLAQALTTPKPAPQKTFAPRAVASASTATAAAPAVAAAPAAAPASAATAPAAAPAAVAPAAAEKTQEKTAPATEPDTPSANGDATPSASTPAPDADGGDATPPANAATPAPADGDGEDDGNAKSNGDDDTDTAASGTATGASAAGKSAAGADGRNPLQCEWTMWYEVSKKGKTTSKSYAPERKKIMAFDTVEDFWCLWNNILKPSELGQKRTNNDKTDYLLFKSGVKPEWEDNKTGGQWELKLGKNPADIDEQWELAALGLIGDQYDSSDEVLGCAIRLRPKGSRLELWTRDARSDAVREIGLQFKQIIQYESRITYSSFAAMKNGESKPMLDI